MATSQRFSSTAAALFAVLAAAGGTVPAARAQAAIVRPQPTPAHENLLTVAASAQVNGTPDTADISLGVTSEAKTAAQASTDEAHLMQGVVTAIGQAGIPQTDIRTEQFNLELEYEQIPNTNSQRVKGFRASNIVQVTVRDIGTNGSKVGPVMDAALAAGANAVNGVSFYIRDDAALRSEALAKAAVQAHAKASVLAHALGIALGRIASITEGSVGGPQPMDGMRMMGMAAAAATPILSGQVTVTATVTLQYHLP